MSKLNPTNDVNDPNGKHLRNRSRFDLSHRNYATMRFGEYSPHFCMSSVPSDNIGLRSEHSIRTMSLKAPLMSSISMKKDYFNVPMQALLPRNWEKVYKNPINGDDVDSPVGTFCVGFIDMVRRSYLKLWRSSFDSTSGDWISNYDAANRLTIYLKALIYGEQFYSAGALFNMLGAKLNRYFQCETLTALDDAVTNGAFSYDDFFDNNIAHFVKLLTNIANSEDSQFLQVSFYDYDGNLDKSYTLNPFYFNDVEINNPLTSNYISLRDFLEKIRTNPNWRFSIIPSLAEDSVLDFLDNYVAGLVFVIPENYRGLNLARPLSYQLVVAHYYSSDSVDYIYNAELFRQLMGAYIYDLDMIDAFDYNGVRTEYDYLSGYYYKKVFEWLSSDILINENKLHLALAYLCNTFAFRRSLRYRDYFVGARTQPLAVGDVNVAVNDEEQNVSVIDVTRNIQKQRFLNAVNRVGNKIEAYLKELFGVVPAYDFHNPAWLGHTDDVVNHSEVQNTASAQQEQANSITSIMRTNASKAAFSFNSDRPSVLIGVTWFDIPRVYSYTIDKEIMHEDRFDMFNPYAQYIGDQAIAQDELGFFANEQTDKSRPFGYTLRYMEYKQKFDTASGAFVKHLPGFAFLGDTSVSNTSSVVLSPDFVRSKNSDLDGLYLRLSGWSLGTYYHFICVTTNYVNASRPMAYAPTIL